MASRDEKVRGKELRLEDGKKQENEVVIKMVVGVRKLRMVELVASKSGFDKATHQPHPQPSTPSLAQATELTQVTVRGLW